VPDVPSVIEVDSPERVTREARFVLWVCLLGIFVSNITLTIVTVALPTIASELSADPSLTNWVTFGPMLVVALFTTPAGRAADNYGRKRIWLWGFGLSLLGMLGSALAPTLGLLICARLVTGLGTALLVPAALAISTALYPPRERAIPVGYWTSTVAISPLVGVIAGGWLLEHMSYRWLFAWQVALGLPPFLAAWLVFPEQRYPSRGRFDWEGSAAIASASVAAMVGATWLGRYGLDAHVLGAAIAFVLASLWAISAENRAENPVVPPALLRDRAISMSVVARFTLNFSYMGGFMTLPYLLQELWRYSPGQVSLMMVFRPLAMGVAGPIAGRLVLRHGADRLLVWGAWAILLATAGFVGLDGTPNVVLLIAGLTVAGAGLGLSSPGSVAVVTQRVGAELLGTVSGLMTLTATLGNALGMAALFAVVETAGGVRDPTAYRLSFVAGTAITAIGLWASLRLAAVMRAE
jgi:DHA2 family methylenomycin A resistance protein-like MFS transporter